MKKIIMLLLLATSFQSWSVIKRHDVDKESYKVDKTPAFYIDMPFEGAAVLIDKHWLLAPAHVIYADMYNYHDKVIMLHGIENRISKLIIHPDFSRVQGDWSKGDPKALNDLLNKTVDIALMRLANPVTHIKPIKIYTGKNELGMTITGFGRGAQGNGLSGEDTNVKLRRRFTYIWYQITKLFSDKAPTQQHYQLYRYNNVITSAKDHWLRFTFEQGKAALPLEGTIGSGDSGGAVVIYQDSTPILVGFAAWREINSDLETHIFGKYEATAVLTRVSYFQDWINAYINEVE